MLNEKAAFELFGTLDASGTELYIDSTPYTVVGVLNDGYKDGLNVFVSVSSTGDISAESLAVSLTDMTEVQVKNELKHASIDETAFVFLNLKMITEIIRDKFFLSGVIALMGIFGIVIVKAVFLVFEMLKKLKSLKRQKYIKGILLDHSGVIYKLIVVTLFIFSLIIAELTLLQYGAEMFLLMSTVKGTFDLLMVSGFQEEIWQLQGLYMISNVIFAAFAVVYTGFILVVSGGTGGKYSGEA